MPFINRLVLLSVWLSAVASLKDLPERARLGRAYKNQQKYYGVTSASDTPQTWDAQIDNFDDTNNATYKQRYYVNSKYWKEGGPVFYEIGGEGTLNGAPGGFIETLGEKYGALLIALEHRFYGESIPNGNVLSENYRYLSVEQAMADLSGFTDYYKSLVPNSASVPWVVFGGSYPGGVASWYRTAYPEQSVGALSSSGVVNCIIDYYQFDMQISAAAGNECGNKLKLVSSAFQRTVDGGNLESALDMFYCEHDMVANDFYYMIADSWSMMIQYGGKTEICSALSGLTVESSDAEVMSTFADFSNMWWGDDFCSMGFYNTKQAADPMRWDINSRSWRYQTCSQVSYFNTAPPVGSIRAPSVNLDYHLQQCAEMFGHKMFPASLEMNQRFGGEFPQATNVFYSDFSDDPWQTASVWFAPSVDQPYHLSTCEDCGHCMDFHTPLDSDPEPVQESRAQFEVYMQQWLAAAGYNGQGMPKA